MPSLTTAAPVLIVSGLPRSGTSLMMQMLEAGGFQIVTDHIRTADTDNPRGYCEFEKVKQVKQDASWLPETRGKVVKMISQLLYDLPPTEEYRVLFMERDLDEVLASQEKMLVRLGKPTAPREAIRKAFLAHLDKLHAWLGRQRNFSVLRVRYRDLLEDPQTGAERITEFLGREGNVEAMTGAVDPSLYRNRAAN